MVNDATHRRAAQMAVTKLFQRRWHTPTQHMAGGTWVLTLQTVRIEMHGPPTWVRAIKTRLTARGFKDMQAFQANMKTYRGTASNRSQRAINAHAAQTGYELFSMDIRAAFLNGMAYNSIAEFTGEPLRYVQFDFPPADAWLLRQLSITTTAWTS